MITIKKTEGVQYSDQCTCVWLQELIYGYKQQCPIGKVVIDAEKINFYKFGLLVGVCRHAPNGIVYDRDGSLTYVGIENPVIKDMEIYNEVFKVLMLKV